MKRFVYVMMVVMMAAGLMAGCASTAETSNANGDTPAETTESADDNVFRVGTECAYPPYNWTQTDDSNGAVAIEGTSQYAGGYDVEIAKLIAEGLGKKLVIVPTVWDGLVPAVQSGVIDAIIAGMSPTEERKESIDFTDSYYREDIVLGMVVKKGGAYENAKGIADFAGAKITAQLGTYHYDKIDQISGVDKQEAMKDFTAMRVALASGIIDGYVSEKPEGESATEADPDIYYFVEFADGQGFNLTEGDTSIAVGVKKGSTELVTAINEILAGITDEQREALMEAAKENQPSA